MMTQARLALRLQRFEVVAVIVAALVIGVSALVVRLRLDSVGVPSTCWDQWFGQGQLTQPTVACTATSVSCTNRRRAASVSTISPPVGGPVR